MATLNPVISSEYCLPQSIKLTINTDKGIAYINDEEIFRVEEPSSTLHNRPRDVSHGNPMCTLRKKIRTMHERWEVFKGASTNSEDLIFSVKRTTMIQWRKIKLGVFLPKNEREKACDYEVHAKFLKRSATVRPVQSSQIIAKMEKNSGDYNVTVESNTDLAFIVTLIIILDKTKHVDKVSTSAFRLARMMVDPFDITGGVCLGRFGGTIGRTIVVTAVKNATENSVTNC